MYEGGTAGRTVDECPDKEGNDIGDSKGDLCEVEAEWSNSERRSECEHPVDVCDSEGETSDRGGVSDHTTVRLDICRSLIVREQLPQGNRAIVGGSNEE